MTKNNIDEEYMRGYTKGFENGYAAGKSAFAACSARPIKLCPVCGLIEGEPCTTTPSCYYGANKNR